MAVKISELIKHAQDPVFRRLLEQAYEPVRKARARLPRWYAPWRYLRKPCDCPTSAHKEAYTRAMPTIVGLGVILGLPALIISLAQNNWFSLPGFISFIAVLWLWITRYHVWQDHLPEREAEVERQDEQGLEDLLLRHIGQHRMAMTKAFDELRERRRGFTYTITDENLPYRVSNQLIDPETVDRGIFDRQVELEAELDRLYIRLDFELKHLKYLEQTKVWDYLEIIHIGGLLETYMNDVLRNCAELKTLDRLFVQTDRDQYLRDLETCASWAKDGEPSGVRITTDDQSVSEELEVEASAQDQAPCLSATK